MCSTIQCSAVRGIRITQLVTSSGNSAMRTTGLCLCLARSLFLSGPSSALPPGSWSRSWPWPTMVLLVTVKCDCHCACQSEVQVQVQVQVLA